MDYMPDGPVVVFVGCGGTYWTSANYFCALLKRLQPSAIHYVDPGEATSQNTERQWCQDWVERHFSKVTRARSDFTPSKLAARSLVWGMTFQEWVSEDRGGSPIGPEADTLVIVNVDNDEARLAVREWCLGRKGRTIMVMSGCDMNYGQVYFGVYQNEGALHDWKPFHPEVGDPERQPIQQAGPAGCGAQSTLSNYLTGALFAPAIHEVVKWWNPNGPVPEWAGEYYWRRDPKKDTTRVWTQKVAGTPVLVEIL